MAILKTEAIVLKRFGFGNTSQIAHLFSRDFGKISLLAKGIQSPRKKDREVFDLLCNYKIVFQKKSHSHLHLLRQMNTHSHFPGIRRHLESIYVGLYLSELVDASTKEEEPHPDLYDLLKRGLEFLDASAGLDWQAFLLAFELRLLKIIGYLPEIHFCLGCGIALDSPGEVHFSKEKGGILCGECKSSACAVMTLNPGAISILRNLSRPRKGGLPRIRLLPKQVRVLRMFMDNYLTYVLEKKLKLSPYLVERGA